MGSVHIECDTKRELDDSGCVQDDFVHNSYNQINLLDLSDDVLLYVLRYCSPRDLKALGFSCIRLGRLVRERSLWRRVDTTAVPCSEARLKWLLDNALHQDTRVLMVSGYARNADGCLGLINVTRKEAAEEKDESSESEAEQIHEIPIPVHLERHHARLFISAQRTPNLPRYRGFPSWTDESDMGRSGPQRCNGPQFSFSPQLLQQLVTTCTQLTTLAVDYCNIDCNRTSLGHFPKMLKKLSLRGTRCFNMAVDKSFLFKIQDHLPVLESLNVSECEWMDPATLLPLSKMPKLEELFMRDCPKLAEFVAYASLTSRYGFRTLRSLDLRGSPVGDSEVSALGWLPRLENLWLASRRRRSVRFKHHHAHYADDPPRAHRQLDDWEAQEPDYFKSKSSPESSDSADSDNPQPSSSHTAPVDGGTKNVTSETSNVNTDRDKEGSSKRKTEDGSGDSADMNGESPLSKRQKVNNDSSDAQGQSNDSKNEEYPKNRIMKINCEINVNVIGVIETDSDDPDAANDEVIDRFDNQEPRNENEARNDENGNNEPNGQNVPNSNKDAQANDDGRNENFRAQNARGGSPDCIVDCIKIDQLIDVGELRCGRQNEVIVIASTSRAKLNNTRQEEGTRNQEKVQADDAKAEETAKPINDDQNDPEPKQNLKRPNENVNEGASTSKDGEKSDEPKEKYVCFRKNQEPVYVNCAPENANQNQQNQRREPLPPIQYQIEPRHHVLYVSVGPQLNTYRFPRDSSELDRHLNLNFRSSHVDSSSLVTDFAMRRFGRADGEDVNIIHIGPNGPMVVGHDTGSRPDRSNLRFLSVTGYRNITDRSLVHLATAAPNLARIDFTDTNISENGAENFRGIRPDCELIFSKYTDNVD
ncbi:uncharacterized protein LOC124542167 isoform X2 [Vanessa cardui]|uniref:uncharacterized protein LOC124542167 isoform X2 n=1 Tax=Vanessa cardui TaxID=171605 RepID=UPI001F130182|nr:uncharacterized protein LOC124542167 isoform X2 [Vanessa cardui]